jgi:general secretion pathway protein A
LHFSYSIYFEKYMYETFFGLKRRPFSFAPDVESYFSVDFVEKSRQTVERTIRKGEGISLVFGATGTGKSLLMRMLRQSLEAEYTVVLVSNSRLETPKALFLQLAHDLNLACSGSETVELRLQVLDFVRKEFCRSLVLLFDESQHLSPSVLEEIRFLTDSADGSAPLFRAILAGTPDFEEKLTSPKLEAFNQRVVSRCYLDSFTGEETSRYITRQTDDLRIAPPHSVSTSLFTESAKRRVYQLTDGIPRLINQLCSAALQFAAEREKENVDEVLINGAWASLQHIEPFETNETDSSTTLESVIPPEQIEEIVDQKRKTFRIRQFDPVEFGTLTDSEPEPIGEPRSFSGNDYKPPYPEDDEDFSEPDSRTEDEAVPPGRVLQLYIPVLTEEPESEPAILNIKVAVALRRKIIPDFYKQERKFRRRYLLEKIQHRLGLFAGLLQKGKKQQPTLPSNESEMNAQSLQAYGAAVLDGRPPFVRKEPHYAYQTPETSPRCDVTYPDPKTGVPITLRWLPEKTGEDERFGVSYTEFLNREKPIATEEQTVQPKPMAVLASIKPAEVPIVRTSLNASLGNRVVPIHCLGLEESFEESQQVSDLAISLAELFQAKPSALQQIEESPEFKGLDEVIQRQLEAVVKRILKAAEKIEKAAEVSEQAGRHVSKAAEFVESEVRSTLPAYTDLFRQWSEFQELISTELEAHRQRNSEPPKFRSLPRRQVIIERTVPTIDVESLLR